MQATYNYIEGSANNPYVLLSSTNGGYFLKHLQQKQTRYEGYHVPFFTDDGWELIKILDNITIHGKVKEVSMNASPIIHLDNKATICWEMDQHALYCTIHNHHGRATITLDTHQMYDYQSFERNYQIVENNHDKHIIIQYTKTGDTNYIYYIAIDSSTPLHWTGNWRQEHYKQDQQRNSSPDTLHVFDAFTTDINGNAKFNIAFGHTIQQAKDNLAAKKEKHKQHKLKQLHQAPADIQQAYIATQKSLEALTISPPQRDTIGIYAGFPWFYQFWTRDEAISLGALLVNHDYEKTKQILLRQIHSPLPDGRLANRFPASQLGSADGIGWTATRLLQLLKLQPKIFSQHELQDIYAVLLHQKEACEQYFMDDNLMHNTALETWMDTGKDEDIRDGYCIEIQLLHQKLNDVLALLAKHLNTEYNPVSRLDKIKEHFYNNTILADRLENDKTPDYTFRPNIYLAYYLYPDLLTQKQWETVLEKTTKALWLPWGGLSSIDKKHKLFHDTYTGQTNESYHRGDSWYFLNNLAAICLFHCNKKKFKTYIQKLLTASSHEILFQGALGHHAEVSSAKARESQGCLAQAWSAAFFIEACIYIFGRK